MKDGLCNKPRSLLEAHLLLPMTEICVQTEYTPYRYPHLWKDCCTLIHTEDERLHKPAVICTEFMIALIQDFDSLSFIRLPEKSLSVLLVKADDGANINLQSPYGTETPTLYASQNGGWCLASGYPWESYV
jgi:hypothetical protein